MLNNLLLSTRTVRIWTKLQGLLLPCPSSCTTAGELLHPGRHLLQSARDGWKLSPPWQIHGQGMSASIRQGMGEQCCTTASATKSLWEKIRNQTTLLLSQDCSKSRTGPGLY